MTPLERDRMNSLCIEVQEEKLIWQVWARPTFTCVDQTAISGSPEHRDKANLRLV
jgi:hypothetical protein